MTFINRQKTQLINNKNQSENSHEVSHYDTGDSKSITLHSGPDRSTTSNLNIKLPPMMGDGVSKIATLDEPSKNLADIISVAPMLDAEDKAENGIRPKKLANRAKGARSVQKSTTFSPRDQIVSKNGSTINQQLSERSNKKQKAVAGSQPFMADDETIHHVRRLQSSKNQGLKGSQKMPIPVFSQTSPMNSIRQDSKRAVEEEEDMDASMQATGGYKNFVIESPNKQNPSSKKDVTSNDAMKDEPRVGAILASDMPPAAIQRVSFGMLPPEMQMQEL